MFTILTLCLFQSQPDPLPPREYQPTLFDPGLDGGVDRSFSRGEFTPDGRLLIAFRRVHDLTYPGAFRFALTASISRPEHLIEDPNGHLESFYDPVVGFSPPSNTGNPYGTSFAFGRYDTSNPDWARIHWGHELVPCSQATGEPCITGCPSSNMTSDMALDPFYPKSDSNGSAHMTVAMRPRSTGNPFPSDADGTYQATGSHTTYELWIVRTHQVDDTYVCNPNPGALIKKASSAVPVFTSQNVTLVIDESTQEIVMTDVEQHAPLLVGTGSDNIEGIEPSITADGRLILFHGNGANSTFESGNGVVTYIFNPSRCSPGGWSAPRSITELPSPAELGSFDEDQFKRMYTLFASEIKMPRSALGGGGSPGLDISGTYPWVSKDGSFYNAFSVLSLEADDDRRQKSAAYVVGDLTNWTIKHIDDVGLNPTRYGAPWAWPRYKNFYPNGPTNPPVYPNSWGAITMSTGVKPGLWEPLPGQGALFPTIDATSRIPVLPLFLPVIDTYGEIRFEEADGNYMLYLACKESLAVDLNPDPTHPGEPWVIDPTTTPDSSGNGAAILCTLNSGAAFPQEASVNTGGGLGTEDLREAVGLAMLGSQEPFHENVGFKGQGIVMNLDGAIDVDGLEPLSGHDAFTLEMFVKSVGSTLVGGQGEATLFEYGLTVGPVDYPTLRLSVDDTGTLIANLHLGDGSTVLTATTRSGALLPAQPLANATLGWRHVAVSFVSSPETSESRMRIYLDGLLEDSDVHPSESVVADNATASDRYYIVGPGRSSTSTVTLNNMAFVIDEVALSNVRRTVDEIRAAAFVAPRDNGLGPWPAEAPFPVALEDALDLEEVFWPVGVDYDEDVVDLGTNLFANTILSKDNSRSCASCHDPAKSFVDPDGSQFPDDIHGVELGPFNTPTLLNSAFGTLKTFEGKASSLEEQLVLPLTSGLEMGDQDMTEVVNRVNGDAYLQSEFVRIFGAPADDDTLIQALAMYLRQQFASSSPYDTDSLTAKERRGKELFFGKARCASCHSGPNFSDGAFHNIRTVPSTSIVQGRGGETGRERELGQIKTPTLRNLSDTGPFFHDGTRTLGAVVSHYNNPFGDPDTDVKGGEHTDRDLKPLNLTGQERRDLVAFLRALTDE